jgi:hypothetical protein
MRPIVDDRDAQPVAVGKTGRGLLICGMWIREDE